MLVHPCLAWSRPGALLLALVLAAGCKGVIGDVGGGGDDPGDPDARRPDRPDARRIDASTGDDGDDGDDGGGTPDARRPDARQPDARQPDAREPDDDDLVFRRANLTNFESYPEPGSDECEDFNGCEWAGRFAFLDSQMSEQWVRDNNIAAVHSRDADEYALKTLRLRADGMQIDVVVYDLCSDSDCGGCCTRNASETGFLIDIEKYTMQRFGMGHGIVEWACVDCD